MHLLQPQDPAPPAEERFPPGITAELLLQGSNYITAQRNPHQLTVSFQTETYGQGDNHCEHELGKILT